MAKNQLDMKSIKNTKKDIQKTVKEANATLLDFSEDIIKGTVKTGEAWQKLMAKAVKNSEPLMKKQSDILFETAKGMKMIPVDAAVVAIVDCVDILGKRVYGKGS